MKASLFRRTTHVIPIPLPVPEQAAAGAGSGMGVAAKAPGGSARVVVTRRAAGWRDALQGISRVVEETEPIRRLDGVGGALAPGLGAIAATITTEHLRLAVLAEPRRDRVSGAVGQQINGPMALQVDDDAAIAMATSDGEVIHTRDGEGRRGSGRAPTSRGNVIRLNRMARRAAKRTPGPGAHRQAGVLEELPQRHAPAGVGRPASCGVGSAKVVRGQAGCRQRTHRT